jgi:peroxiredoxin
LRDSYDDITAKGAKVVAIGTGNPMFARAFVDEMSIPFTVLIDTDGKAAQAASLRSMKPWDLFNPKLWKRSLEAKRNGFNQTKPGKRPMQLGAQFVVSKGGTVAFSHLEHDPSDHAPVNALLAAL